MKGNNLAIVFGLVLVGAILPLCMQSDERVLCKTWPKSATSLVLRPLQHIIILLSFSLSAASIAVTAICVKTAT